MSSLKDKFDDFREEPQNASWQKLLGRLNQEMPVRKRGRYLLWFLPIFIIGTAGAVWLLSSQNSAKLENTTSYSPQSPSLKPIEISASVTAPNQANSGMPLPVSQSSVRKQLPSKGTNLPIKTKAITSPKLEIPPAKETIQSKPVQAGIAIENSENNYKIAKVSIASEIASKAFFIENSKNIVSPLNTDTLDIHRPTLKPKAELGEKFVLEIYYAPGVSNIFLKDPLVKFLNSKTTSSNKNLRNSITNVGFSYTTGFGLKMNVRPDLRVKTGYYLTQINQTLYYDLNASKCNCGKDVALAQLDAGIGEPDMQNISDTISAGKSNSFTNQYSLREIPFIFEYQRPTTKYKNLSYVVNAGISYMYLSGLNVKIPDADNVGFLTSSLSKTSNVAVFPSYKDAFNIILGGGLLYKAGRNVEYMMAPQFKMAVTSLSKNDRWFREYPWQMQVALGIGKRF